LGTWKQIVRTDAVAVHVRPELCDEVRTELHPSVLLVLGVLLHQEAFSGRMELGDELNDKATLHRKDSRREIDVPRPHVCQLAPAKASLDVKLNSRGLTFEGSDA
jgi:hypothetical protein